MLSIQDLLDFCDLGHKEIEAIADHQRIPLVAAAELGQRLIQTDQGQIKLHSMLLDSMHSALARGEKERLLQLTEGFLSFHRQYPLTTLAYAQRSV